ncbi:MAG: DUF438 domain-containing protein, partial [Chloroflexi bacterium]|nr:DUF438 domain-containing protein [Chloroflexota bacterium]
MSEYINNSAKRQETLKELIRQLHDGAPFEQVKRRFAAMLQEVDATEIARLEQALMDEGMPEMEVKRLCDVHVAVFRESLDTQAPAQAAVGHPLDVMREENAAAAQALDALEAALQTLAKEPTPANRGKAQQALARLREYDKHYLRQENILFPYLERHGFMGPSSVMWAIHDDVRAAWKSLAALLDDPSATPQKVADVFGPLAQAIREMFYKEERILFPNALKLLSDEEWQAIAEQEGEIGRFAGAPAAGEAAATEAGAATPGGEGLLLLQTGALTLQQVNWL